MQLPSQFYSSLQNRYLNKGRQILRFLTEHKMFAILTPVLIYTGTAGYEVTYE